MDDGKIEEAVLPGGRTGRQSAREGWLFKSAPKSGAKKKRGRSRRDDTWWVWVRVEIEDAAPSAPLGVKRDGGTKA